MVEVRREDAASAGMPHHAQTPLGQDYSKCNITNSQPATWGQHLKAASYESPHIAPAGSCTTGSIWGTSRGSLGTLSSSAPQFSAASPARRVDVVFCQQMAPIPRWQYYGGCRENVASSAASLSMGSGAPVRNPSALNHLYHESGAIPAGVLSYGVSEGGLPSSSAALRGSSSVTHADSHLRGQPAVPYGQSPVGMFDRRETSPPIPAVQHPPTQPAAGGFFGPRTSLSPTVAAVGLPVSRHFNPLREAPFELVKFIRRDPYTHFYIPVDCPYARRCANGVCPFAHTKLEKMFHPIVYKTQKCQMALSDTGPCPYINQCTFFHTEEDRKQAELEREVWEAEWGPWRPQMCQFLRSHHTFEKGIRRKIEGVIKIRMPRSSSSGCLGRDLENIGVLTRFGEQKKPAIQQGSQGVRPLGSGESQAAFSSTRGRSFSESGFAGEGMAGLADSGTSQSDPRLAKSVSLCGLADAPLPTSAVFGNTRRSVEHHKDRAFPAAPECLYIANAWSNKCAQHCRPGGGLGSRLETSTSSTRSTLQETVATLGKDRKAFRSSGTLPELGGKQDTIASLPSAHGSSHGVLGQRVAHSDGLHVSPHTFCGCSPLSFNSKDGEYLPLRTGEASVLSVTTGEVEAGKGVASTVMTSETRQALMISTPADANVASGMSTCESRDHEGASSYRKSLNVFVCKPLHFAVSTQASAASGKPAVAGTLQSAQPAVEREPADTLQMFGSCRIPAQPISVIIPAQLSCSQIKNCEDERGKALTSGGSSCRSNTLRSPRAEPPLVELDVPLAENTVNQSGSSDSYFLRHHGQQAINVEGQEDSKKVVCTRGESEVPSPTEGGQVGDLQGGSEGGSHQQPSTCKRNTGALDLRSAQTGRVASQSERLDGQEPLREPDDGESVIQAACASQAMPLQPGISLLDASPSSLPKDGYVAQVEPLSSVTSQRPSISPGSCTHAFRLSAVVELPGRGSADGSTSSTLPEEFGGDAQAEAVRKYNASSILLLPNQNVALSAGDAVNSLPKPVAAGSPQGTLEERTFGQFWNPAAPADGAATHSPLPDVSEGEAFSVAIDAVMCQNKIPSRDGCVTGAKDELNLLAGNLKHLLRTATEKIRRLDIGTAGGLARTDYQLDNQLRDEPTLTLSGTMDGSALPGLRNSECAEVLSSSNVSPAGGERQRCASTVPRSGTPDDTLD
ncbi:uncharacterized protein EMH_0016670 [Eimeria mitis]|uniref:C3H1-type domain-containing protein n=1 Tax=Eimeria mitis TaxID=44415 RepID=U6K6J1_9EIME|nr:uncharacterized protein EMH_0016670 [Eimeria mitis]CDJ33579.1 hypothetical protein EMH_0016670 [Eimeria mitis]